MTKVEERLKGKVFVTAGTHEVGYTWREKQFERQDVWETSLRDSQEVHLAGGLPRLRTVSVARPVQRQGREQIRRAASASSCAVRRRRPTSRRAPSASSRR